MSDKHAQMRELARGMIRDSVIEDAIAQKITQIIEFIHEDRIKPLQTRVEMLERERALYEIVKIEEETPQKQVQWANDYGKNRGNIWYDTRAEANDNAAGDRIAVIRREWVEGQLPQYFTERV
jgi:hypothetical protein